MRWQVPVDWSCEWTGLMTERIFFCKELLREQTYFQRAAQDYDQEETDRSGAVLDQTKCISRVLCPFASGTDIPRYHFQLI